MSSRDFRHPLLDCESPRAAESIPFLTQEHGFPLISDLESGSQRDGSPCGSLAPNKGPSSRTDAAFFPQPLAQLPIHALSKWAWRWRFPSWQRLVGGRRPSNLTTRHDHNPDSTTPRRHRRDHRQAALRKVLRLLAISLMLLGFLELVSLVCGLLAAFFPNDLDWFFGSGREAEEISEDLGRWPTDFTADIHPVGCHSHNDYWRKQPLFSAINAGCTGVEADVWLFNQELYVGHTTAALTANRTLRNLYINPLVNLLDQQNPLTTFHPSLDRPKNGVFDTNPSQTLVLLIDFKSNGEAVWPHVSDQLEPLRERGYLSSFNGTSWTQGPITVVATGNAPFKNVVASAPYRDIFFDAPLDQLADTVNQPLSPSATSTAFVDQPFQLNDRNATPVVPRGTNANKGRRDDSDAALLNSVVYSLANSYYASASFTSAVGWPWRSGRLSHRQRELIQKQIAGAHARGLKVRYWDVPSWPRGMRNYLWRVLVREGVDYLNVDDLRAATEDDWFWPGGRDRKGHKRSWWDNWTGWGIWS